MPYSREMLSVPAGRKRPGTLDDFTMLPDFIYAEGGAADLTNTEKLVLCVIYNYSRSAAGSYWGTVDRLARKLAATDRGCRSAIATLRDKGYIEYKGKHAFSPTVQSNVWAANPEAIEGLQRRYAAYWDAKEFLASLWNCARGALYLAKTRKIKDGTAPLKASAQEAERMLSKVDCDLSAMRGLCASLESELAAAMELPGFAMMSFGDIMEAANAASQKARSDSPEKISGQDVENNNPSSKPPLWKTGFDDESFPHPDLKKFQGKGGRNFRSRPEEISGNIYRTNTDIKKNPSPRADAAGGAQGDPASSTRQDSATFAEPAPAQGEAQRAAAETGMGGLAPAMGAARGFSKKKDSGDKRASREPSQAMPSPLGESTGKLSGADSKAKPSAPAGPVPTAPTEALNGSAQGADGAGAAARAGGENGPKANPGELNPQRRAAAQARGAGAPGEAPAFVPHPSPAAPAWAAEGAELSEYERRRRAMAQRQAEYSRAAATAASTQARPAGAPSLSAGGPELVDEREFEGLRQCTAEEARKALDELLRLAKNKRNLNLVPRAYVTLLHEGAKPEDLVEAWRHKRAEAGGRDGEFQPQLAKWLMQPLSDQGSARAAMAKRQGLGARRKAVDRGSRAAELYRIDDAFKEAYDAFHDDATLSDADRESARQVCTAMLDDYIRSIEGAVPA